MRTQHWGLGKEKQKTSDFLPGRQGMSGVVRETSLRYTTNPHLPCSQPVFTSYEVIHCTSYPTQLHKVIFSSRFSSPYTARHILPSNEFFPKAALDPTLIGAPLSLLPFYFITLNSSVIPASGILHIFHIKSKNKKSGSILSAFFKYVHYYTFLAS